MISRNSRLYRGHDERGFVLVVVLVLLVVLTLLAGTVALSGRQAVARAQREIDLFQSHLDMLSTRETVLFMYATQHRNLGGLVAEHRPPLTMDSFDTDTDGTRMLPDGSEIRLDATPYTGVGSAVFALQDDHGLISLNWTMPALRQALYAHFKVPPDQWNALDAKRLDYQDEDSLHRLGGAEEAHYREAGLPSPPNRTLTTPLEVRRILQWNTMLEDVGDGELLGMLSMSRHTAVNVNTAPARVLAMLPGLDAGHAERMVALRKRAPFTSEYQVMQTFPLEPFMYDVLLLFPSSSGNLILQDRRFGATRLIHWTLTPMEFGGPPWRIDYEVILPRDNRDGEAAVQTPSTPLLATQDASGERGQSGT